MTRRKNIQLCYPFEEKRLNKWKPPYIVQPKYDGDRCRAIRIPGGNYVLLSSEENFIFGTPHINNQLDSLPKDFDLELDGELYYHGWNHQQIHGVVSRQMNIHRDHQRISLYLFDICNESQPQSSRLALLSRQVSETVKHLPNIQIVPFWLCENLTDIMKVYDNLINNNYEGIIVRNLAAPYVRKRSTAVMKFKPKQSDTYEIIGWKEEISKDGNAKGRLGSFICKTSNADVFSVGSGLTDDQRERYWRIRRTLIGSNLRVEYQHITSGNKVPRFPIVGKVI